MMSNKIVLSLKNVSKTYRSSGSKAGIRQTITALDNISFEVKEKEVVALIGPNGCGKTTLLRAIGGTLAVEGSIARYSHPRTIIELTQNLINEATGIENIYYFGSMIGLTKSSLKKQMNAIINFAGLNNVIAEPINQYSSGMRMKLAFAVATVGEPKIICLDEIIAVGDKDFSQKSYERFRKLQEMKATIIIATHQLEMVKSIASRAIYLKDGHLVADGKPKQVVAQYEND